MATYRKVHPFPSLPTVIKDKVLELLFNSFLVRVVLAFVRGSGASRLINGHDAALPPGTPVYVSANNTVLPATSATGAVGVINAINDVPIGGVCDIKSVGEYDVPIDDPGGGAGESLFLGATPGSFTNVIAGNPSGGIVSNAEYVATGKVKVVLCLPVCPVNPQ